MNTSGILKRILMSADTIGGVWTYAMELIRGLNDYDIEVVLATMGRPLDRAQRKTAAALSNLDIVESDFQLEWMEDPWSEVDLAGIWLLGLEEEHRPDVIHLNGYSHGNLRWHHPCLVAGHSCVASWWNAVRGGILPPEWNTYRQRVAAGLRGADQVVVPTYAMRDALQKWHGPLSAIRVIPNGSTPLSTVDLAKEEIVLSVGRLWDEAKNMRLITEIAPRLNWPMYVAGEWNSQEQNNESHPAVHWLGKLDSTDLRNCYQSASIYAAPALYEPFGLAILEAAQHGCALVLSDIPSLRENWTDAACFVPADDPEAWIDAINRLSQEEARRRHLSEAAQQRASLFTREKMAAVYMDAYRNLLHTPETSTLVTA